jgi:hypothetical protein
MSIQTFDYCVPVTVAGQAPGQTATVELFVLVYQQPSDVAAKQAVETQIAQMCQLLSPNELVSEFQVGQPMPVQVSPLPVA